MEHLILIDFEKDPDEFYHAFELQKACEKDDMKSFLVIAYCNDGSVDIYHQAAYPLGSQASILNEASFFVRSLDDVKFEKSTDFLYVYFSFEDKMGRRIAVKVNESNLSKKLPFFLLAPVGVVSKQPISLPIYSLYEMSFTKQKWTDIDITINDVKHKPDAFPLPIEYSKNYFTRYSADTFNLDWNKNVNGTLSALIPDKDHRAEDHGTIYELHNNEGHYEIVSLSAKNEKHKLSIRFFPAIPDLACLKDDIEVNGHFTITTDQSTGNIRGGFSLKRNLNTIKIQIQPKEGWQPNEKRWILKVLFKVVKVFKEWPKSYVWYATISFDIPNQPVIQSNWERI